MHRKFTLFTTASLLAVLLAFSTGCSSGGSSVPASPTTPAVLQYETGSNSGQVSVDSKGSVTAKLSGATASTAFTVQFCPYSRDTTCFNVGTVSSDPSGNATGTMPFPKSGNWAGVFEFEDSSGNAFAGAPSVPSQVVYMVTLQPYNMFQCVEAPACPGGLQGEQQDPLSSGSVTLLPSGLFQFKLSGATPNTFYGAGY